jgi:Type I restriction modification DNA specificity domain
VCIRSNRFRYSFGRQANRSIREILIPSPEEIPSWVHDAAVDFLEDAAAAVNPSEGVPISTDGWRWVALGELFDLKKGKRLTKAEQTLGPTPFIGAIDGNNGLARRIGQSAIHEGGTITVNYNGNGVAEAFYQPSPFWASDDVNVLYPKFELNPYLSS